MTVIRFHPKGVCLLCNQPFSDANVFTDAGQREVLISGICEKCFDQICEPMEDAP